MYNKIQIHYIAKSIGSPPFNEHVILEISKSTNLNV